LAAVWSLMICAAMALNTAVQSFLLGVPQAPECGS
jgi:hypothetical protein